MNARAGERGSRAPVALGVAPGWALLVLCYMSGIFALSSLPPSELARLGLAGGIADLAHIPLFAGLAWIAVWSLVGPRLPCVLLAGAACAIFALSDEWHQAFVPGRVPSSGDLAADGAGIVIGLAAVSLWEGARRSRTAEGGVDE